MTIVNLSQTQRDAGKTIYRHDQHPKYFKLVVVGIAASACLTSYSYEKLKIVKKRINR